MLHVVNPVIIDSLLAHSSFTLNNAHRVASCPGNMPLLTQVALTNNNSYIMCSFMSLFYHKTTRHQYAILFVIKHFHAFSLIFPYNGKNNFHHCSSPPIPVDIVIVLQVDMVELFLTLSYRKREKYIQVNLKFTPPPAPAFRRRRRRRAGVKKKRIYPAKGRGGGERVQATKNLFPSTWK